MQRPLDFFVYSQGLVEYRLAFNDFTILLYHLTRRRVRLWALHRGTGSTSGEKQMVVEYMVFVVVNCQRSSSIYATILLDLFLRYPFRSFGTGKLLSNCDIDGQSFGTVWANKERVSIALVERSEILRDVLHCDYHQE